MRYKISFQKTGEQNSSISLHHQKHVSQWIDTMMDVATSNSSGINFSSFKGTSKVQNGMIRFLSTKITLVISSSDANLVTQLSDKIMSLPTAEIGKMQVKPKKAELIADPEFLAKMKYVCISPIVPDASQVQGIDGQPSIPTSHEFSDHIFHHLMDGMEKQGFTAAQLDEFQVFAVSPDKEYLAKMQSAGKKIARVYQDKNGNEFFGYLFPFTLHAHPSVQKFIWENGLGDMINEGYGMIDLADKPPVSHAQPE